ncbi:DUF2971 domain-containing protein [Agrobacterium tumefaciens]|uniref:DUF2971 domain-containing protein n=1 Tax=Agrobacterium tumefaciens TaxID=358 RepID=UPI000EF229D0|nr:DUF2971 domain-containing protein [Agrobacterium tumefaciens]AYM13425.1 hypothetical protein At1D1108_37990 [Agrobacterium tumefaciens]MEA1843746.1 DUF2971 domain-containing protein [Agrobacterium tumefaciens]NSY92564.1 DUF2971 domain-containing protein [Agrobacterium tumefaciens]NTA44469.1 DUF2971 domain-containing protein [Agrobacterium tumefaciens]WCK21076.1 DUF2971 domain-containing protein [Agrobacterium tumefaciens]
MRLYYYTKLQYGLMAVRDQRIKISSFETLNDPFDFVGIATSNEDDRRTVQAHKDDIKSRAGLLCMSETWKEPLMWGHYADNHRGVSLAFEVNPNKFRQVSYVEERPKLEDFGAKKVTDLKGEVIDRISTMKFNQWSYEREWRSFVRLLNLDYVDGNHFKLFDNHLVLKGVLFGSRCDIRDDRLTYVLQKHDKIKVGFVRPAHSKFDIVIDQPKTKKWLDMGRGVKYDWSSKELKFDDEIELLDD